MTGPLSEIEEMARARYIYFEKMPSSGGGYEVIHSANIRLADASGRFAGTLDPNEAMPTKILKVRALFD